jgi:4-amino-4-deoxy-L-arabinose transferase-like glycosyltransferase
MITNMLNNRLQFHTLAIHSLILLAICLPYCINLGKSSIWDANEAFYAETPREMLVTGDYLAPKFNFQPRIQKPPLTYWAVLVSYKLFGVNEFAVRLPGALAAIGIILFCYGTARILFGPDAALMASVIAATTPRMFILARRLPIDILLLFFMTGTLFFLIRTLQKKDKFSWLFVYIFLSLGFLTKGPIAVIIPAATCLLWMLRNRRLKIAEICLLPGMLVFIIISLPWYLAVFLAHGWTYIAPFFLSDNLGRFASETLGPSRGFFYYFSIYATDFFPWSFLALFAAFRLWAGRKDEAPIKNLSFGLLLIWCLLTFALFSFSKNKQEYYIAPIYPAAAIIISGVLEKSLRRKSSSMPLQEASATGLDTTKSAPESIRTERLGGWAWLYALLAFLFFLFSIILPYILSSFIPEVSLVLHYAPSLVFICGSMLLIRSIMRQRPVRCFSALAIPLWVVFFMGALFYVPALEAFRPIKSFCKLIETHARSGDEAGYFRTALPSMVFYLRQPIFQESNYQRMERRFQSDKRIFCVLSEKDYVYFKNKGMRVYILHRRSRFTVRFGALLNAGYSPGEELLLVSNQFFPENTPGEGRPTL